MTNFTERAPLALRRDASGMPTRKRTCTASGSRPKSRDLNIAYMDTKLPAPNSYGVLRDDERLLKAILSHHQTAREIAKTREWTRLLQWVIGALLFAGVIAFAVHQGSPLPVLHALLGAAVGTLWRRHRAAAPESDLE